MARFLQRLLLLSLFSCLPALTTVAFNTQLCGATASSRAAGATAAAAPHREFKVRPRHRGSAALSSRPPFIRAAAPRCGLLDILGGGGDDDKAPAIAVGDRVRVSKSMKLMHVPGHKSGLDVKGYEGEILRIYEENNLSPNREVKVAFDEPKRWIGHFEAHELEPL